MGKKRRADRRLRARGQQTASKGEKENGGKGRCDGFVLSDSNAANTSLKMIETIETIETIEAIETIEMIAEDVVMRGL